MVKRVALAPKLDTAAVPELQKILVDAKDDDIVLDAAEVKMIGALCVELLMSAAAIWKSAGQSVTIEGASTEMIEDLGRLGLTTDTLLEYAA
jgi:chemotaxis protein CheX